MSKDKNKEKTIIPFKQNDTVEMLEQLLELARNGQIKNFVAAGFMNNGDVFTTTASTDVIEHHTLNSYLQQNVILRTIEVNQI